MNGSHPLIGGSEESGRGEGGYWGRTFRKSILNCGWGMRGSGEWGCMGGIIHDLRASAATRKTMQATKLNLHKFTYKISVAENVDFMSTIY